MAKDYASSFFEPDNKITPAYPTKKQRTDYAAQLLQETPPQEPKHPGMDIQKGNGASFATLTKAAMVDDPASKLNIFAKTRFPDDPDAVQRYGVIDGEVVYLGKDGKLHQETPEGFWGSAKEFAADLAGKSPTIAGGIVGAVKGSRFGWPGAGSGAVFGAMSGEAQRKLIGNMALDEQQTSKGNAREIVSEGFYGLGGEIIGGLLAKFLNRNVARDFKRYDPVAGKRLEDNAAAVGIELFPPQVTNLRSVKGKFEALGRLEASADIIDEAMLKQAEQANKAAYDYFGMISTEENLLKSKQAASDILQRMKGEREGLAAPFYQNAWKKRVVTTPELAELGQTPIMQKALTDAKRLAANAGVDLGKAQNTMLGLHWTQMALSNMIDAAKSTGVGGVERRQMMDIRNQVLDFMDKESIDYAMGRYLYAGESGAMDKAAAGLTGEIAEATDENLPVLARRFFSPASNSPNKIRDAHRLFVRHGKKNEWNSLARAYLQDQFEMAGRYADGAVGQPPRFRKWMIGNPRQKEVLRAALSPHEFQALEALSDVFEAMGRVRGTGGSPTMPLQEAAEGLRRESEGFAPKILKPRNAVIEWLREARLGDHAEKLAEIITTPGDVARLRELAKLSKNEEALIAGFGALIGLGAPATAQSNTERPLTLRQLTQTK